MIRRITILVAAAVLALSLSVPAFALSPRAECEAQGGTFSQGPGGVKTCTIVEEGKNPKFTQEEETSQQGRIGNQGTEDTFDQDTQCAESNPGNSCPGGQFN